MDDEEKLRLVSEYRFTYWPPDGAAGTLQVKRGHRELADSWAIYDGPHAWSGVLWSVELRSADAYCWDEDEALIIAKLLARQKNAAIIDIMERKSPGEFRGGPHDLAAKGP